MKISKVASGILLSVAISSSAFAGSPTIKENPKAAESLGKNLKFYNNTLKPLSENVSKYADEITWYNGVKNLTTDSIKESGENAALGKLLNGYFSLVKTAQEGFDYGSSREDDGFVELEDKYGHISINSKNRFTFTKEDGVKVRINTWGNDIWLADENGNGVNFSLNGNGEVEVKGYGSSSLEFSKRDLEILSGAIKDKMTQTKENVIKEGFFETIYVALKTQNTDNALLKEYGARLSEFGDVDAILKSKETMKNESVKEKKHVDEIEKLAKAIKSATGDKTQSIATLNKYLRDNDITIGAGAAGSREYYDGFLTKIDENTDMDTLLKLVEISRLEEAELYRVYDEADKLLADNKDKILEILGLKEPTPKPTPPAISVTEKEATEKLEAINDSALAVKSEQAKAATKFDEAKKALDEAKKTGASDVSAKQKALDEAKSELAKVEEKVAEVKKEQVAAATQKAKAIAENKDNALTTNEQNIVKSLGEISGNDQILAIMSEDKATIIEAVRTVQNEIQSVSDSLNRGITTDIIKFNTNLATTTRLAKLSNPYNDNLALASAINSLSGTTFASGDHSALSSVVRAYTDRFKYDNNLWGTLMGGKAKIKGGANPKIYGFTLGYDKAFDNTIVGGFMTYAKSKSDNKVVKNDADNYQFGVYSRSFIDAHEIDAKVSFGFGKNDFKRTDSLTSQQRDAKYDSKFASIDLEYGYVYEINEGKFIKPLAGASYSYVKNDAFSESGVAGLNYDKTSSKILSLKLGAEFRAYINDGSFAYITPGIEREIYKHGDDFMANFIGSNNQIIIGNDDKKKTYATMQMGVDFAITPNLSTNINFGYKGKSKENYYNGTVGVRYKF
ncbi:autotransporter domain-containing protein [Campylobacter sp. 9BO]|uniref:autotransporter outer membrane beta-barrel domain-containing protein n=1 Tax=Campylobacter sp. 9BO TaxID=3424759 RepID=UPI003D35122F